MQVPHVSRQDFSLLDISDDGFVRLPDLLGCTRPSADAAWALAPRPHARCRSWTMLATPRTT